MGPTVGAAGQSDRSWGDGRPLGTELGRWTRIPGGLTGNLESALCWAVAMVTGISAAGLLCIQSEHLEGPQKKILILESLGGFRSPDAAAFIGLSRGLCPASRTLRGFKWCFVGTHISQQCLGGH